MCRKCLFIFSILLSPLIAHASDPVDSCVDKDQQQLEWCFKYSNMFGYNISSISNPKLYQSVYEWLGTPYRYSGTSKRGIDCSGLVCELYKSGFDMCINGCAKDLYNNTDFVSADELKEGDLVFFKIRKSRISHVGIYLGQNKFVHSSTQRGVTVSDLDDPYYHKYFYKGGRIKK